MFLKKTLIPSWIRNTVFNSSFSLGYERWALLVAHKFSLRTLPVYYLSVRDNGNMNSNGSVALQCKQVMEK